MPRTTVDEVESIADFSELSSSDLQEFIDDAHDIVEIRLEGRLAEVQLRLVEKWLAAHLASMREQRIAETTMGDSGRVYEGDSGLQLEATRYGQQAKWFDTTGKLTSNDPVQVSTTDIENSGV